MFDYLRVRITFRLYKIKNNTNTDTNQAIIGKIPNVKLNLYDDLDQDHEYKESLELINGHTIYHISPGTFESSFKKGDMPTTSIEVMKI